MSNEGSQDSQLQKKWNPPATIPQLSIAWVVEWACLYGLTPLIDGTASLSSSSLSSYLGPSFLFHSPF
jgi:hypothetical protein